MTWEVISSLPPGGTSRTRLARDGGVRVALRTLVPGCEPFIVGSSSSAVLPLLDVIEVEGQRCAVYDFVPGATLAEIIDALRAKGRAVRLDLLARVVIDASRAVGAIHTAVSPRAHGGLSDSALLVGFDGDTRVLDFGASRSPGRFAAPDTGITADVFCLGAILHSALTGFAGEYRSAVAASVELPTPSSVSPEATPALDDVVMTALAAEPAGRQGNAVQLADELEAVLAELAMPAKGVGTLVQALLGERLQTLKHLAVSRPVPSAELELAVPTGEQGIIPEAARTSPGSPPSAAVLAARAASEPLEPAADATRNARLPKSTSDTDRSNLSVRDPEPVEDDPHALGGSPPEGTAPRIPRPVAMAEAEGTSPGFRVPARDTSNDLKPVPLDAEPVHNTTESERLKARGQERIPTPPFGSAAAHAPIDGEAPIAKVPTAVRRAHDPEAQPGDGEAAPLADPARDTADTEPPIAGETTTARRRPRRARQVIAALLLVIAVGVGAAAWTGKLVKKPVVIAVEPEPLAADDAGSTPEAVVVPEPALAADAAVEEEDDAGVEATVDAGPVDAHLDAGKKPVKPVKKPPLKKKRRVR